MLTVLAAQVAAFSIFLVLEHYAPDMEGEPVFGCADSTGENFAANPRKLFGDLSRWLPADGFARAGVRNYVDFREGVNIPATEAIFARGGVTVMLTLFDGDPCQTHGRELRMDWQVTGPGSAAPPVWNGLPQWVEASKSGGKPIPIGEATDPRPGRPGFWAALLIFEALLLTFVLWPYRGEAKSSLPTRLPVANTGPSRCRIVRRDGVITLAVFPPGLFGTELGGACVIACGAVFGFLSLGAYSGASGILPFVVLGGLATVIAGNLPEGCQRALQQVEFDLQPDALVRTAIGPDGLFEQQTWPRDQIQEVRIATKKHEDDRLTLVLSVGTEQPVYAANPEIVREVAGELRSLLGLSEESHMAAVIGTG